MHRFVLLQIKLKSNVTDKSDRDLYDSNPWPLDDNSLGEPAEGSLSFLEPPPAKQSRKNVARCVWLRGWPGDARPDEL